MNAANGKYPDLIPFSFPDLEEQNADYLDLIKKESARIINETREEICRLKEKADNELNQRRIVLDDFERQLLEGKKDLDRRAEELEQKTYESAQRNGFENGVNEGRERGYAEGLADAERKCRETMAGRLKEMTDRKVDEILPVLNNMTKELLGVRQSLLKHWEENILQIAAAIAYQTIMREVPQKAQISLDLLKEALDLAVGSSSIKIRMNPGDLEELRDPVTKLAGELKNSVKLELEADPKVASAGCVIETPVGIIDQRLESRLERIIAELS